LRRRRPVLAAKPGGQTIFATLPQDRRTWVVGSVHGDCERLSALHAVLATQLRGDDNLVYLGNLLGRGPDVLATIDEALVFRRLVLAARAADDAPAVVYLRGRQEEMWHKLLQIQLAPSPRQLLEWMLDQGVGATLAAYGGTLEEARVAANGGAVALTRWTNRLRGAMRGCDGHQQLISGLKRAAFTADRSLLLVNAGIDPTRPLDAQGDSFWWDARGFEALLEPYNGYRRVVRGFDPEHNGASVGEVSACLDGGCGYGGTLLAGCFDAAGDLVDLIEA
jgi:serine/threonine protein phosphatase 1